jgi:hypothetical protein
MNKELHKKATIDLGNWLNGEMVLYDFIIHTQVVAHYTKNTLIIKTSTL